MRKNGLGTVYRRGQSWVIDYYVSGKRIRETIKTARSESAARAKLKERISQIHTNTFIRYEEKLGFEGLVTMIEDEYRLKQRRGMVTMRVHVKHLWEFFKHRPAISMQPAVIVEYQKHRLEQKASPATINRETACLHHMLQIAYDMGKLSRVPKFTKLEGERVREGFLTFGDFNRVLAEINGTWRKNLIEFLFLTGWRSGKAKSLEWRQIFLTESPWVKTDPGSSTKKSGSDLPLTGKLLEIVREQLKVRRLHCPYVFHDEGRKIGDMRKSWHNATKKAGLEGKVIHDFRRSTARNLTSLGVPQQVIMARCGWKLPAPFTGMRSLTQEWDKRRNDFAVVTKLAEKHSSILEFIGEYVLDPLYVTARNAAEDDDLVTVITIHSAKGTEREICYVLNRSPQAFPTSFAIGNADKVEEERRVLYVALTRAKNELIITRHCPSGNGGFSLWARTDDSPQEEKPETYFLNSLPDNLLVEQVHQQSYPVFRNGAPEASGDFHVGITID